MKVTAPSEFSIRRFWRWFQRNIQTIEAKLLNEDSAGLAQMFDNQMHDLSRRVGWEVGPAEVQGYAFALTLKGDQTNYDFAKRIAAFAPKIDNWEVCIGRMKKKWDFTFFFPVEPSRRVAIDARSWKYVLTGYDNCSFFDIVIVAPSLSQFSREFQELVVSFTLESVLGECEYLRRIGNIEIVGSAESSLRSRLSSIQTLDQHIADLTK